MSVWSDQTALVNPVIPDARTGEAEEGVVDFGCDAAVIPRKTRIHADIRSATWNERLEEIVGVSEHHECGRPQRIASDHVQQLHLDRIGEKRVSVSTLPVLGLTAVRAAASARTDAQRPSLARLPADVKRRRMSSECRMASS